eukprot:704071-Prymnesium_polylepis.1
MRNDLRTNEERTTIREKVKKKQKRHSESVKVKKKSSIEGPAAGGVCSGESGHASSGKTLVHG